MNFKSYLTKSIVAGSMLLSATACVDKTADDNVGLFALASAQINGLAQGNCAISINHTGLRYGAVVQTAVLNGGTATGVFSNALLNGGIDVFDQAAYEEVTGSTVTSQGYASYAAVPYNLKYDAFFKWDAAKRNAVLDWSKRFRDAFLFIGYLAIGDPTTAASVFPTGTQATVVSLVATGGANPTLCSTFGGYGTNCSGATPGLAASFGVLDNTDGTASLACARIPRANCSVGALTTKSQVDDIKRSLRVRDLVFSNPLCALDATSATDLRRNLLRGAPVSAQVENGIVTSVARTNSSTTGPNSAILGEAAYPKFGTLVDLGFGALMPIRSGARAFEVSASNYIAGSNLNARVVTSCESIGIETGLTGGDLSPVSEIVYAFSEPGSAATAYANAVGADLTDSDDPNAVACNTSFRNAVNNGLPLALKNAGVRIDTKVRANAGNAGATETLGLCVYGGSATQRTFAKTLINAGIGVIPDDCGSAALNVVRANRFGDEGLRTFTANNAGDAINGE
jgi:hypothetical protein